MRIFALAIVFLAHGALFADEITAPTLEDLQSITQAPPEKESKEEFRKNLTTLLERTETSIEILRDQLLASQSAPFLPDLYMQLAELLATKASVLYYIQMEREGKNDSLELSAKETSPIVETQREAIEIHQRILRDFPKFGKRVKVYYLLASSLKAIDDNAKFMVMTEKMASEFPKARETARVRLLLGQSYFDKGELAEATKALAPVTKCNFPFERATANHRMALIYLAEEKPEKSLRTLEKIVTSTDFNDDESPMEVSLKTRQVKSSLKREALIDSVRAYTGVFESGSDPVQYYAKIAPNEILYTEVLEKLAYRFVSLKRYDEAIQLMRTLSTRTLDPQKVVNMYREVLGATPIKDRLEIPPDEMRHVLQRLSKWLAYYQIPSKQASDAERFFETQVRDLGTRNHAVAKEEKDPKRRAQYIERARRYYQLYLAHFKTTPARAKLATNLADIYYSQRKYPKAADLYLRAYSGEFGKNVDKKSLLRNAIGTAQKTEEYSYYEQLRIRGILSRAINSYFDYSPKSVNDPKLNFLLLKTQYEQGDFKDTLPRLFRFVEKHHKSKYSAYAAELILDYHNTRKDYQGLMQATERLSKIPGAGEELLAKVTAIKTQAASKVMDEKIRQSSGGDFDQFEQGKSYLESAVSLKDQNLKSAALQKALSRSKEEADVSTFFNTAKVIARDEKDPEKRAQILRSVSKEKVRLTHYYEAIDMLLDISEDPKAPENQRASSFNEAVELVLVLRDWDYLAELAREKSWARLPEGVRSKVRDQVINLLESPTPVPDALVSELLRGKLTDAAVLAMYKAQPRLSPKAKQKLRSDIASLCGGGGSSVVCKWEMARETEVGRAKLATALDRAPASVKGIEQGAKVFGDLSAKYQQMENSGDLQLDMVISLKQHFLFKAFAGYLNRVAQQAPDLKDVLVAKTKESQESANQQLARCRNLAAKSPMVTPANRYCMSGKDASIEEMLYFDGTLSITSKKGPTKNEFLGDLEKRLFTAKNASEPMIQAAEKYYSSGYYNHAAAASTLGSALYPDEEGDFKAVLGCSLTQLGLLNEASFHLKAASSFGGYATKCTQAIAKARGRS